MYDVPQKSICSPHSTRSKMSFTPTRQSPMRLPSPTKSHATPLRTRQQSPRKSPAKRNLFDTMTNQAVHFTPEKTRQPPRAWERRPATPFVPRDDKQKIWKRVPLGEIGIEPNRPMNISRREQEATKDYVRVVKKLKVGHGSDDDDKENISLDVKTDCDRGDVKRKFHVDSRFVSMKMEEDEIVGSPKKKLRIFPVESESFIRQDDSEGSEDDNGDETEDEYEIEEDSESPFEQDEDAQQALPVKGQPCIVQADAKETLQIAADPTDMSTSLDTRTVDPASAESTMDASEHEQEASPSHGPAENTEATSQNVADSECTATETISVEGLPTQRTEVMEPRQAMSTALKGEDDSTGSADSLTSKSDIAEENTTDDMEPDHMEVAVPEEPGSSSPPTILAENVVVDELESRDALADASNIVLTPPSTAQGEQAGSGSQQHQEFAHRRVSDDEAAFLRNFVSNSKAERAARAKKVQQNHLEQSSSQEDGRLDQPKTLQESSEETPCVTLEAPSLEPSTTDSVDNITGSPLRRSKRAAITSIPRPQILPNAIQLKRANGNEFIFTANKASSVANIAHVTRTNTKRNKGSALTVPERLEQLLANDAPAEENGEAVQIEGEAKDSTATDTTVKETTKKRKREAKEGTTRTKKVLRWNDEKLVSYQEAKRCLDDTEDIDDSSQENNSPQDHEMQDSEKHVKLTLTLSSSGSSKPSTEDDKENSSSSTPRSSKVRRVRRGTSGTVNGTPGPKTRSRRIVGDDERDLNSDIPIDDNGSIEDSTAATAAINDLANTAEVPKTATTTTTAAKRSRMPMPVSSGLPTRRGAAASASIRSTNAAMRNAAATPGESKKVKEVPKSQVVKEDTKGDLLGKRRLRVRS